MTVVLALAAAAVVAGMRSFTAIADWAADVPAGPHEDAVVCRLLGQGEPARSVRRPGRLAPGRTSRSPIPPPTARITTRTIQVLPAPDDLPFPHVSQVYLIERHVTGPDGKPLSAVAAPGVTSLTTHRACPARLAFIVRGQWLSGPCTGSVLPGSPGRRMTLHRAHDGELSQQTSMGVVLVVAAALTLPSGAGPLVQHLWRDYPMLINR